MEHSLFMTTGAVAAHQNRQHTALDHLACGVVSIYILDIVARHRTYHYWKQRLCLVPEALGKAHKILGK
jgi:hypothetical protein